MSSLKTSELVLFNKLDAIVKGGVDVFIGVGQALMQIKALRLYRREFNTFEAYCIHNKITRSRAYQYMDMAVVHEALPQETSTMVDTERATRELKKVPEEDRVAVVKAASKKKDGKVTGKAIAEAAATLVTKRDKPKVVDKMGFPIPDEVIQFWDRSPEINELLTALSDVKTALRNAQDSDDPMYAEINFSTTIGDIEKARESIKRGLPYAVCTQCAGHPKAMSETVACPLCRGRGLLSKYKWDHNVAEEWKTMRAKAIEKG